MGWEGISTASMRKKNVHIIEYVFLSVERFEAQTDVKLDNLCWRNTLGLCVRCCQAFDDDLNYPHYPVKHHKDRFQVVCNLHCTMGHIIRLFRLVSVRRRSTYESIRKRMRQRGKSVFIMIKQVLLDTDGQFLGGYSLCSWSYQHSNRCFHRNPSDLCCMESPNAQATKNSSGGIILGSHRVLSICGFQNVRFSHHVGYVLPSVCDLAH